MMRFSNLKWSTQYDGNCAANGGVRWNSRPSSGQTGSGWGLKFARLIPLGYPNSSLQYERKWMSIAPPGGAEVWTLWPSSGQIGSGRGLKFCMSSSLGHTNLTYLSLQFHLNPVKFCLIRAFQIWNRPFFTLDVPKLHNRFQKLLQFLIEIFTGC